MSRDIGTVYEDHAIQYLTQRGLTLITRNYSKKTGEIDLIMDHDGTRVFVEVRFRRRSDYGPSIETIRVNKQLKIIKTALIYLQRNNLLDKVDCRIDVVAIDESNLSSIEWFKNVIEVHD